MTSKRFDSIDSIPELAAWLREVAQPPNLWLRDLARKIEAIAEPRKPPSQLQLSKTYTCYQWLKNGDHPNDYRGRRGLEDGKLRLFSGEECRARGWEGEVVRYFRHPSIDPSTTCPECGQIFHNHGWIDNRSGGSTVCPGDYIFQDVTGAYFAFPRKELEELFDIVGPEGGCTWEFIGRSSLMCGRPIVKEYPHHNSHGPVNLCIVHSREHEADCEKCRELKLDPPPTL